MTFGTWRWWVRQPLPSRMFLVLIFTRGWVNPRAMARSKGNMSLKNPVTPPGIDPGTVRLAQPLNHYATPGPLPLISVLAKVTEMPYAKTRSIRLWPSNCRLNAVRIFFFHMTPETFAKHCWTIHIFSHTNKANFTQSHFKVPYKRFHRIRWNFSWKSSNKKLLECSDFQAWRSTLRT